MPEPEGAGSKALKVAFATRDSPPAAIPGALSFPAHQRGMQGGDPTLLSRSGDIFKELDFEWSLIKLWCLQRAPCCLQETGGCVAVLLAGPQSGRTLARMQPDGSLGMQPGIFLRPL